MLKAFHSAISAARFMFMPSTDYRPGYGEARKRFTRVFSPKMNFRRIPEFTSVTWGRTFLLRSVAIAYQGAKAVVASPKVEKGAWFFFAIGASG